MSEWKREDVESYYGYQIAPLFSKLSDMCNYTSTEKRDIQNLNFLIEQRVKELLGYLTDDNN